MRETVRTQILEAIQKLQPCSESAVADELGASAPALEVLRTYLVRLEVHGAIRRDNNRRFTVMEQMPPPAQPQEGNEMPKPKGPTKICLRCEEDKALDQFGKWQKTCLSCQAENSPAPKEPTPGGARNPKAKKHQAAADSGKCFVSNLISIQLVQAHGERSSLQLTHAAAVELLNTLQEALAA